MVVTDKFILKECYFLENQSDPDFDTWYQIVGYVSMMFYLGLSLKYHDGYKKLVVQIVSYAD